MEIYEVNNLRLFELDRAWEKYNYLSSKNTFTGMFRLKNYYRAEELKKKIAVHMTRNVKQYYPDSVKRYTHWRISLIRDLKYVTFGTRIEIEILTGE